MECGIKPVFVFDGKPPDLKKAEIEERKEKREEADKALAAAKEEGDEAEVEKMSKRTIRVTKVHNEECKLLLKLMGIPIIEVCLLPFQDVDHCVLAVFVYLCLLAYSTSNLFSFVSISLLFNCKCRLQVRLKPSARSYVRKAKCMP